MSQNSIHKTMTVSDWALLAFLSLVWGGSFFFNGVIVRELPPLTIVALRVGLAAVALHVVLRAMGVRLAYGRRVWMAFLGMGILNNAIPFSLIVWGQSHISSGLASILNATTPLFTVVVAHYLTDDERLTGLRLTGVAVGFAGVVVMIGSSGLASLDADVLAQFAVLGAALSYACAGVFGRRFKAMGVPPLATATGQVTASSLILLPLALVMDRPWTLGMPGPEVILSLAGLSLVSTALAYIVFFRLLARAGATNAGLVTFLVPVSAILLGVLILGETLEMRHIAGMALIGMGLVLIDGRLIALPGNPFSAKKPEPRGNG